LAGAAGAADLDCVLPAFSFLGFFFSGALVGCVAAAGLLVVGCGFAGAGFAAGGGFATVGLGLLALVVLGWGCF
jgi:hypothetical protein